MDTHNHFAVRTRTFDYLQLHWLEKTSGRPRHDWDLYIIKELIDNAIDADEKWAQKTEKTIEITIELIYDHLPVNDIHALEISVSNQASFLGTSGSLTE